MQQIKVTRYEGSKTWAGAIEPADKSWIGFVDLENKLHVYLHRDPITGACLSNDPTEREAELVAIRARAPDHLGRRPGEAPAVNGG